MENCQALQWEPVDLHHPPKIWIDKSRIELYSGARKLVDVDKYDYVEIKKGYSNGNYNRIGLFFTNENTQNAIHINKRKDLINICNAGVVRKLSVPSGSYSIEKISDSALAIILN